MVAHGQSDHHHSHLWDRFTPQKVASTNNIWPKITNLPLSCLSVWSIAPAMHYLREQAICLLQNTMRTTTARSRKTTNPQYSNRVQSACLTLLTLSGPWPAWLWWLSARSQLGSQAIKWGQPLLFRGTIILRLFAWKKRCTSVSPNLVFILQRIHHIYVLYFPEYILKSHLNLSFNA